MSRVAEANGSPVAAGPRRIAIYGAGADYFNAYSTQEMAAVIAKLIDPTAQDHQSTLRSKGAEVSAQYLPERVLPQWQDFLRRVGP